jgi:hypothetical protein
MVLHAAKLIEGAAASLSGLPPLPLVLNATEHPTAA